jgi:hypothetical protein
VVVDDSQSASLSLVAPLIAEAQFSESTRPLNDVAYLWIAQHHLLQKTILIV